MDYFKLYKVVPNNFSTCSKKSYFPPVTAEALQLEEQSFLFIEVFLFQHDRKQFFHLKSFTRWRRRVNILVLSMTHISVVLKDRFKHGRALIGDEQLGQPNLIKSYKAVHEL